MNGDVFVKDGIRSYQLIGKVRHASRMTDSIEHFFRKHRVCLASLVSKLSKHKKTLSAR
jgi:hypothetical protein